MNVLYAKTLLYVYPHVDKIIGQIDELVEKKAAYSINDYSPAFNQCAKIAELTRCKAVLLNIKAVCSGILKGYSAKESVYLDYKYFKKNNATAYAGYDFSSRNYFRRQVRLAVKFSKDLEKNGITDKAFIEEILTCAFMRKIFASVKEQERLARKNKSRAEKQAIKERQQSGNAAAKMLSNGANVTSKINVNSAVDGKRRVTA